MTDQRGPLLTSRPSESLPLGNLAPALQYEVSTKLADELRGEIGSSTRGSLAPHGVLLLGFLHALREAIGGIPSGGVLIREELDIHADVEVPAVLSITTSVVDKYARRSRQCVVFEFRVHNGATLVAVGRKTLIWSRNAGS